MTADLKVFAKVRALHDSTTNPGEKASDAARMQTLARKAGMTVAEAVSKLDSEAERQSGPSFADIFDTPFFRQAKADRERERAERWRRVLAEYGSEEAVFAPGPWERALAAAVERFVVRKTTTGWPIGSLWGWHGTSLKDPAPEIVEAIATAYPMPASVRQAWVEFLFWDKLYRDREAHSMGAGDHAPAVQFRTVLIERQLNTLPAMTLNDLRARLDWFDWRNDLENAPDPKEERIRLATLRADIERMGARIREQDDARHGGAPRDGSGQGHGALVQSGHGKGSAPDAYSSGAGGFTGRSQNPSCPPSPVQSGRPTNPTKSGQSDRTGSAGSVRRTNADKRHDVLELLGSAEHLTDREIARRAGVSPSTVGTIRRSMA